MKITYLHHNIGQSLVEMALLLPVLVLLSVATIDFGRGIYYYSVIYNAAREGARYGIVRQQPYNTFPLDTAGIDAQARKITAGLDQSNITVVVESPIVSDTIKVNVSYCFNLVTPIAKQFLKSECPNHTDGIKLASSSSMVIER